MGPRGQLGGQVGAPAASERKMRRGQPEGLTAVGPWAQPLNVPLGSRGSCWAVVLGWVGGGWDSGQGETCPLPTPRRLGPSLGPRGQPRDTAGVPFRPTAWTNVDDGPRQGRERRTAPSGAGDSLAWIGPLGKTPNDPTAPRGADGQGEAPTALAAGNDPTAASAPGPSAASWRP